ncbi:MAG: carbohydrate ABC transporter permease [Lachnospiraceae bacterium]|nr:carbohydrate ABC transporter permease [Lachnospiraceae bacterium]MDY5521503.1 carbohydrate ABC transporter permease [Agathobacter sp.]
MAKNTEQVSTVRRAKHGGLLTALFAVLSILWISPLFIVLLNSFKRKAFIFRYPFGLSSASITEGWDAFVAGAKQIFCGLLNYQNGIKQTNFWECFGNSLFITVASVAVIILCCSMCAWYIVRVNSKGTKIMYLLCLFSMIVPFQMVMFTLSKFANMLHLSTPLGIIVVYLGFGAGLSVFMFTGFVKSISLEIEEAAMIDGCSPVQTFFLVVFPILKPTTVTVAILQAMWVWNDYLLPNLVLSTNKYKTIPIAVQFLKQSHGQVDWGAMMAVLVLAILPIVIFYIACQKYIIEGVLAGAVKG